MRNPCRCADASVQAPPARVEGQTAAVDGVRDGTVVGTAGQHLVTNVTLANADDTAELIVDGSGPPATVIKDVLSVLISLAIAPLVPG